MCLIVKLLFKLPQPIQERRVQDPPGLKYQGKTLVVHHGHIFIMPRLWRVTILRHLEIQMNVGAENPAAQPVR